MPSDHWTGPIVCPHCGTPRDEVYIATRILGGDEMANLRAGMSVDIDRDGIRPEHYLWLRPKHSRPELRILEVWWCETCGRQRWAEVVIRDGTFAELHAVLLTLAVVDCADLIATDDLGDVFPGWTGQSLFPDDDWRKPPRPDWKDLLRAYLAEQPQ